MRLASYADTGCSNTLQKGFFYENSTKPRGARGMKRLYVTLTIRQLKAKVSRLSRTAFKVTRNFFQSRLGIVKRDWSRLTKAEIIRVLDYYYGSLVPDLAKT